MASNKSLETIVDVIRYRMLEVEEVTMWWNITTDDKEAPPLNNTERTGDFSSANNLTSGSNTLEPVSMVGLNSATRTSWTTLPALAAESWTNHDNSGMRTSMNLMSPRTTYSFNNEPPLPGLVRALEPKSDSSLTSDTSVLSSLDTRPMPLWPVEEVAGPMNGLSKPPENDSFDDVTPVQNLCRLFEFQARCAQRPTFSSRRLCTFCKRNGEPINVYMSHTLRNEGRVVCPILRRYICPLCGATGDTAHTISYCHLSDGTSTMEAIRTFRKSCGCVRVCKHGVMRRH